MADYTLSAKITGDSSGFEKAFSTAQKTVDSFSQKFDSIGKKISSVGDSLTSKITKPALAAGTALAGITLGKGFSRLTGIDDARAKLQGLGHDAQSIEAIMDSALTSVQGTAFGLDEAATTAANAVAAGIKPGQELTRYLTMTADAAAIAGTSMSEMGSIINKVQTGQTVYTEDLEQLADRGLPVYQWLAEEAGVAASEVKQLASDGQISSQMLYNAIEKNIGGAAQIMGETSFFAAVDNIGASIARIGANFLDAGGQGGGFFSQLKPLMAEFSDQLAVVETKATELGVKFGSAFSSGIQAIQNIKSRFDALPASVQNVITMAAAIGAAFLVGIGPVLKITGTLVSGFGTIATVLGALASPIGVVIAAIAGLASGFAYLMQTNDNFKNAVLAAWDAIGEKVQVVQGIISGIDFGGIFDGAVAQIKTFAPAFESAFETVKVVASTLKGAFSAFFDGLSTGFSGGISSVAGFGSTFLAILGVISPGIKAVLMLFQNFGPQIINLVSIIGSNLVPVFATLGSTIGGVASSVMPAIQSAVANLLPVISQVFGTVAQIASTVLPVIVGLINQLSPFLVQIASVLGQIFAALAPIVAQLISTLLPVITNIITVLSNVITAIMPSLVAILNVVMSVFQAVAPVMMNILSVVISVISSIISAISPIISFVGLVITTIMAAISPIVTFIANIIATIIGVIGTVVSAVSDVFSTVYSIVSGVFSNIANFVSTAINTIGTIVATLSATFSSVFNSIYSIVSSVMGNVRSFITGVFSAIRSAWSGLTGFVSGVFSEIAGAVQTLVGQVKGFVNGVISGINAAISVINMIPGVSIGSIPYLAHGTDNWQGGFAVMNEGGRGELTYLPNGAQVIPHDISVKYAKEAARNNATVEPLDATALGQYIVAAVGEQGAQIADGVERGISGIKFAARDKEVMRYMESLGFVRG